MKETIPAPRELTFFFKEESRMIAPPGIGPNTAVAPLWDVMFRNNEW